MNEHPLEALRRERGISVAELARRARISRETWYSVIRGKHRPTAVVQKAIADVLGMDEEAAS